jgi:predicted ATP-grasp superfamily ATP-dependent carboligase
MAPVLVLDEGDRGDLGLVRSLGIAGIPVHLVTHDPAGTTAASRYVTRLHIFPPPSESTAIQIAALRGIAEDLGDRPPVMMAGDRALELVSEHREELEDVLSFDLPTQDVVRTCFNKDQFAVESTRLGLPAPATHVMASAEEARSVAPTLQYPVFVKPFVKEAWGRLPAGVVEEQKGQRVDRPEDLVTLFDRLKPHGADAALVQHFVESPDSEHYSVHAYVAPDGVFMGAFTTRKIRVWPPHRGIGSLVTSEVVPELIALSRTIMDRLSYTGFALIQFKRDMNTGQFLLLEINCRYSTSGELAARCGANFPAVSYAYQFGRPVPAVGQTEGPAWLDLERDLAAMELYRELGEWTWRGFLKSLISVRYPAYLAFDDPKPFFRMIGKRLRRRFGRFYAFTNT